MSGDTKTVVNAAALVAAGVLGGAAALAGAAALGRLGGDTTTIREVVPDRALTSAAFPQGETALTLGEVYSQSSKSRRQGRSRSIRSIRSPNVSARSARAS